jgi:MoaA/NifB/PqqE/SkfB family radical SAM enzyme
VRFPANSAEKERELSFEEIKNLAEQAGQLGCRRWNLSGGEPMLRPDFPAIFETLTDRSAGYTLNTNGTLITPEIARLMRRKGVKLVSLYGATAETYDRVARRPGAFEMAMRGFRLLQEAGAGFMVQAVPMAANRHEWDRMLELAQSLSPRWRIGASWLYKSACRDPERNSTIESQRLDVADAVALNQSGRSGGVADGGEFEHNGEDDRLFARCIAGRRDFHVDASGGMTFCAFIRDPGMRYDLRNGTFREGWEDFIPSLADRVRGGREYRDNCGTCEDRADCPWCPVFGWLEHGRFDAPVKYLCDLTAGERRFREEWRTRHRRYYRIAGITIQVDSDLAIQDGTFQSRFDSFRAEGPGTDTVSIRHHFGLPDLEGMNLGRKLYRKVPWAIHGNGGFYHYIGIQSAEDGSAPHRVATFNSDHSSGTIYNDGEAHWRRGNIASLTLFPSDQIWIARLLADREGCYLHSAGAVIDDAGVLFVGHSRAGKSTVTRMLMDAGEQDGPSVEILCDDRNIVRRTGGEWRVYGTWSHGEVPLVSSNHAPLRAVCFLEKADANALDSLTDRRQIVRRLLACIVRPFVTADWWNKTLDLTGELAADVPCFVMRFDRSGAIVDALRERLAGTAAATGCAVRNG